MSIIIEFNPADRELNKKIKENVEIAGKVVEDFLKGMPNSDANAISKFSFTPLTTALHTYIVRLEENNCLKNIEFVALNARIDYIVKLLNLLKDAAAQASISGTEQPADHPSNPNTIALAVISELTKLASNLAPFKDAEDVVYVNGCGTYKFGDVEGKFYGEEKIVIGEKGTLRIYSNNICKLSVANTSAKYIDFNGHFIHLKHLNCSGCPLVKLDVTKLKALKSLNCEDCKSLKFLEASGLEELHSIKVKCCSSLQYLNCYDCKELSELDMTMLQNVVPPRELDAYNGIYTGSILIQDKDTVDKLGKSILFNIIKQLIDYANKYNNHLHDEHDTCDSFKFPTFFPPCPHGGLPIFPGKKYMDLDEPAQPMPPFDFNIDITCTRVIGAVIKYVLANVVDIVTNAMVYGFENRDVYRLNYKQVTFVKNFVEMLVNKIKSKPFQAPNIDSCDVPNLGTKHDEIIGWFNTIIQAWFELSVINASPTEVSCLLKTLLRNNGEFSNFTSKLGPNDYSKWPFPEESFDKLYKEELLTFFSRFDELLALDYKVNRSLQYLNCGKTDLHTIDLQNLDGLIYLNCRDVRVCRLDVGHLYELRYLNCSNTEVSRLKVENLMNLTRLVCNDCKYLTNIQKVLFSLARFTIDKYLDFNYKLKTVDNLQFLQPPAREPDCGEHDYCECEHARRDYNHCRISYC